MTTSARWTTWTNNRELIDVQCFSTTNGHLAAPKNENGLVGGRKEVINFPTAVKFCDDMEPNMFLLDDIMQCLAILESIDVECLAP